MTGHSKPGLKSSAGVTVYASVRKQAPSPTGAQRKANDWTLKRIEERRRRVWTVTMEERRRWEDGEESEEKARSSEIHCSLHLLQSDAGTNVQVQHESERKNTRLIPLHFAVPPNASAYPLH
ncbi:hypothetical protein WMY93_027654 [Mugilogobius chulae]|uniref:Uncharacterized protein n=1 Tax=Mugilogobius chulae TaxID=88201 RepID=A0AAW0MX06_9GOBI